MTQPDVSALARKWRMDVNTGTASVPVWTTCNGIRELTPPGPTPTLQDDGVYEDGGWGSSTKTGLDWVLNGTLVRRMEPDDTTQYDDGQESLRAAAFALGSSGQRQVRWYDRDGGPEAYSGWCEVTWAPQGGDRTALELVQITLTGRGAMTAITNPVAATPAAPTVTALSPATGAAAGGTLVKITGTHFVGVTAAAHVKFDATNATSYFVQDSETIYAVAPAHAAGTVDVTVVATGGTSATTGTGNDYVYV